MGRKKRFNPVEQAIGEGLEKLRKGYGLEMTSEQLSRYLDKTKVNEVLQSIYGSNEFQRIKTDKEKAQFLYDNIVEYISKNKPFDKRGKKLFGKGLEGRVGGFWNRVLGGNKENYNGLEETAEQISSTVAQSPESYAQSPELVEAVGKLRGTKGKGALAEILYASGKIGKKAYRNVKESIADYSQRIFDLAKDYVSNPAVSYASAILGIGCILFFNQAKITGGAIGIQSSSSSVLTIVGVALILISILSFRLRRNEKE